MFALRQAFAFYNEKSNFPADTNLKYFCWISPITFSQRRENPKDTSYAISPIMNQSKCQILFFKQISKLDIKWTGPVLLTQKPVSFFFSFLIFILFFNEKKINKSHRIIQGIRVKYKERLLAVVLTFSMCQLFISVHTWQSTKLIEFLYLHAEIRSRCSQMTLLWCDLLVDIYGESKTLWWALKLLTH